MEVEWNPKTVLNFIKTCRSHGGIPAFRTRYAGARLKLDHGYKVIGICLGGGDEEPVDFINVPEEIVDELEERVGDWRYLFARYSMELGKPPIIR